MQFGPKITDASSPFEKATSHIYDDLQPTGVRKRFFRNGTVALYSFNGISLNFIQYEVRPTSFFNECFLQPTTNADGSRWLNCSSGLLWNATLYYKNMTEDEATTQTLRI